MRGTDSVIVRGPESHHLRRHHHLKKEELFRQCVLCDIEAQPQQAGAESNLLIAKAAIEKNGWHGDYIDWLCQQDCRQLEREDPFPTQDVLAMLD